MSRWPDLAAVLLTVVTAMAVGCESEPPAPTRPAPPPTVKPQRPQPRRHAPALSGTAVPLGRYEGTAQKGAGIDGGTIEVNVGDRGRVNGTFTLGDGTVVNLHGPGTRPKLGVRATGKNGDTTASMRGKFRDGELRGFIIGVIDNRRNFRTKFSAKLVESLAPVPTGPELLADGKLAPGKYISADDVETVLDRARLRLTITEGRIRGAFDGTADGSMFSIPLVGRISPGALDAHIRGNRGTDIAKADLTVVDGAIVATVKARLRERGVTMRLPLQEWDGTLPRVEYEPPPDTGSVPPVEEVEVVAEPRMPIGTYLGSVVSGRPSDATVKLSFVDGGALSGVFQSDEDGGLFVPLEGSLIRNNEVRAFGRASNGDATLRGHWDPDKDVLTATVAGRQAGDGYSVQIEAHLYVPDP